MRLAQNRRDFLAGLTAAGAAGLLGARPALAEDRPPEVTTIRVGYDPEFACVAPRTIVEESLRAEGFTDVRLLPPPASVMSGTLDFNSETAAWLVSNVDAGEPITALTGMHVGCYELFVHEPIRTISDLKSKKVAINDLGSGAHLYLTIMIAQVGLDPKSDVEWVVPSDGNTKELFIARKVDAFLGFPPEPQELRARRIGQVILNTAMDAPWSDYFCCMIYGSRTWVRDHPVATKRFVRAILKGVDLCASAPQTAARRLVEAGFTGNYDYALQTLTEIPYDKWRDYDPEDSIRFFALRLREVGMIKSTPQEIIAQGTDWRFLNELKRELKA
jgi:NitT/TauT family transport system substrate-binding protein